MKIIVALVTVVMATICWTGVNAQNGTDPEGDTIDQAAFDAANGNLSSDNVTDMMAQMEAVGGANGSTWISWDPHRGFYPVPYRDRKCEDGPVRVLLRNPYVYYWPPVYVDRCRGRCPYNRRDNCIARKTVKRSVWVVTYKRFYVWGKYIWVRTSTRRICVKDETCCECKGCEDIKTHRECVKTRPCPDSYNKNTHCFWKPYRSWPTDHSWKPSSWGSCACCKRIKCIREQYFDYDRCQCRCRPIRCPGFYVQDPDTCKCVCPHKDVPCGLKKKIDPCTCQCKCKPFYCRRPRIPNFTTCHCDCPKTIRCRRPYVLNSATCRCECPWFYKCPPKYYWNRRFCKCIYLYGYPPYG